MQFERKKTDEVYEHWKLCEGRRPNLRKFRLALEKFTENAWKYKIGAAPFTYGEDKDYWCDMRKLNDYDKRQYHVTRHIRIEQKIKDQDAARKAQMEEHLEYLFMAERDTTKALIHKELKDLKAASKGRGAGVSNMMRQAANNQRNQQRKEDENKASPRFDQSDDCNVKRVPESYKPGKRSSTDSVHNRVPASAIKEASQLVQ